MKDLLEKLSRLKVLVVGDIMLDHYVVGDVSRISPEAPVPVVAVEEDKYVLGAAANVALNVVQLGCQTEVIGKIGHDRAGEMIKHLFDTSNIRFDSAFAVSGIDTIMKSRVVARGQQLCRIDREKKKHFYEISEENLINAISEKIRCVDAVILSDYAKGTFSESNISKFIDAAHAHAVFIAIDPKPSNKLHFSGVSLMTPNRTEAMAMAGVDDDDEMSLTEICEIICRKYCTQTLVVTLGPDGMLICGEDRKFLKIPTYAREVFDVSGAGDTAVACLTLSLTAKESLIRSAKFANIASGIVVSKHGTVAISAREMLDHAHEHSLLT